MVGAQCENAHKALGMGKELLSGCRALQVLSCHPVGKQRGRIGT